MYYILTKKDEKTVARTDFVDVANMIADGFTEECLVRWVTINTEIPEGQKFSET